MNHPERDLPDLSALSALDFRLDGYTLADGSDDYLFHALTTNHDCLAPLVTHHTDDGRNSYLVLHDTAATWDIPGSPQLLAMTLTRDPDNRTFRFDAERHPLISLAQRWLIARGAAPDAVRMPPERTGARPADSLTTVLEEQLMTSGTRYDVVEHYTDDCTEYETSVLVHDTDPTSVGKPYRLFLETWSPDSPTYTLREGAFPDVEAAWEWMENREGPLPAPRTPLPAVLATPRAGAARTTTRRSPQPPPASLLPAKPPTPPSPGLRR
ncbi:hypothetical protein [Streptomyces caatingaensis]|uniref:Glycosyl hydrolase n=1 Tax=Streptomyces caatingaensis TaxID=1678637 RepID=A0A0K9XLB4_9ACTN|nr:hypothetical protein [Streptomyces caatingaensis]KNB53472.1 hypothetical protein AC230_02015 [Streptomyces caatingaensis]